MSKPVTDKKRFIDLLHRAIQPFVPKEGETKGQKKHGGCNDKQIRQRKTEDASDLPSDKSHQ